MALKPKKKGVGLEVKTFPGQDGNTYLVYRTPRGAYHVFLEVEAKEAARQCGAQDDGKHNTVTLWEKLWEKNA
jgi:hypothetical protein